MGVPVDLLDSPDDARAAAELFLRVWQLEPQDAPVSPDLLRALRHTGSYVAGVRHGGVLIAASVAFPAGNDRTVLHSHITAVAPEAQGAAVGYALKLHQRKWAIAHDFREITWTFDPLVRRNGWFNLVKLGGRAVSYHRDFYGTMNGINAGDSSDRLLVSWRLDADISRRPAARPEDRARHLCEVPADIVTLRQTDPVQAREWRSHVRSVMEPLFAQGLVATEMTRDGCYVFERPDEQQ